jgi:xanthine/CO dehydrogenase XdhC/CoxF family maturation factor
VRREVDFVGARHIGQKLSALASMLEYRVLVVDSRAEMLSGERLPDADEFVCAGPEHVYDVCEITERNSVVILTHAAEHDRDVLRSVIGFTGPLHRHDRQELARFLYHYCESIGSPMNLRTT